VLSPTFANAGHLFTQASSNTPTWIQQGQGISIQQYGDEGGSGSGSITINFEAPSSTVPAGATQTGSDWWNWSAGDVIRINLPLNGTSYVTTVAYDAASGTCSYDFCGVTSPTLNVTNSALGSVGSLPAHSGERNGGNYTSSDTYFGWSITSLAGEFALGGYRIYTDAGTIDGTGAGPLDQSSVVSADQADSGATTPSIRPINAASDVIGGLGTTTTYQFDGGNLVTDADIASNFTITDNGGSMEVAAGSTKAMSGVLSDETGASGAFGKVGSGTLILSGTNTYTGGTAVHGGTLQISSDSNLGASTGGVTLNGGTLATTADITSSRAVSLGSSNGTVDTASATTLTLSGVIAGTGSLTKTGAGNLTVTGTNTYTGATTVSAGTLDLDGSLASVVTVASGARIEGTGNGGGLTASGTVAPGNSPGTLSFAGDVTFTSSNTFITELDGLTYDANGGAGTYDRLAVTGATSTFTAGGTIAPILRGISAPANNDLDPVIGDAFRVVTTANASGVSGAFSTVTDPSSGMPTNTRFDVLYGGNYVDLVLTPDDLGTFAQAYGIQNMVNAANALDTVRPAQGTNGTTDKDQFFNGLYGLTASQVAQALLQASGEIHAFALSDARDGWQSGVGVVRSASQDADRNYWLDVSGYDLAVDQDSIASSYDGTTQRLWIGTDVYQAEAYVLGVAVGVSNSDITTADTGSAETKTTSLAVYMNGSQGSFEYDGILSVNRSEIDTTRTVDLRTGALTNTSSSTARGAALTAQVGYRYEIEDGNLSSLVWLRGDVDTTKADGFVEDGSTVTALTVREQDMRSADVSLGYTVSGEIPNNDQAAGTWNLGIGASKTIDRGMPYVSRTMSMHGATWNVSVPQSGDVAKFASAGIDLPLGDDANMWLNIAATERDGSLAKSAAFGFQVQW
jgi:autotransporter-associated beta strand protein